MTKPSPDRLHEDLLKGAIPAFQFFLPWRHVPDTRFFAKNAEGLFLFLSPNLLELNGLKHEDDVLGLTDYDLYPKSIAEKFRQDDRTVMKSGKPLTGIVEVFLDEKGTPEWYVTNKFPIRTADGTIVGVMGTSRKYGGQVPEINLYPGLDKAIRYLKDHFTEDVSVPKLADMVHMSMRQFQRIFLHFFKVPPTQYRIRMRVLAACDMLLRDNRSLSQIAAALGFSDESRFISHFKRHMGITPLQYRLKHR